jgi:two-component system, chemotaxis family, protein-glutamate methylesterase/glutaminase
MAAADVPGAIGRDIIVIGSSAGGIEALQALVSGLPADLPAALMTVQHMTPHFPSRLPQILSRAGPLPAMHPQDGDPIQHGHIYVAPPDYHLTLTYGQIQVRKGPKEHGTRPAIDPLFQSAARAYGPRVVGVILTGLLDDGTAGLIAVKVEGGIAVVQDPAEASFAAMPRSALRYLKVDYCLALEEIPPALVRLAQPPVTMREGEMMADTLDRACDLIRQEVAAVERGELVDCPTTTSCPDCGGTIWRIQEGELTQFQCREGHRYAPNSFLAEHAVTLERVMWTAARMLEERASLAREQAYTARQRHDQAGVESWEREAREAQRNAELIRQMLT